jgi:hypothetical protein
MTVIFISKKRRKEEGKYAKNKTKNKPQLRQNVLFCAFE